MIAFNKPYGGFSVPAAGKELANTGFSSRYLLLPFFTDISTLAVGNIYYRKIDTIANGSLASDIDVITVDEAVRSSQNLSDYKSDLVIKVTWDRVGRYGGDTSEVSSVKPV